MKRLQGKTGKALSCCWKSRELLLAGALGFWVAGFWVAEDGWHHRRALWLVFPFVLLGGDQIVRAASGVRWLWLVALLLGWQSLSRSWAAPPLVQAGEIGDSIVVFVLAAALVVTGGKKRLGVWIVGGLAILGAVVVLYSLLTFYGSPSRDLGVHRLRNMLVYSDGLNAVLTGMLCAAGAVAGAWFARSGENKARQVSWLIVLAVLVFGVMASQSRGPMLGMMVGLAMICFFERRSFILRGLWIGGVVGLYFCVALWTGGSDGFVERGSAGRIAIYQWFLERISGLELMFGWGFGAESSIPEEELGWFVHHPHSSYLTQLILGGALGLALLVAVLGWSWREAWGEGRRGECLWVALLSCGLVTLIVDGGEIFTLHSIPRLEWLMVVFPAALAVGRGLKQGALDLRNDE
ncbi:MAG: O-antigen ligase family protein, partial [Roseibacillus sp.]|nr:O-antigen ligase family protein [Roseibacillus sp.]